MKCCRNCYKYVKIETKNGLKRWAIERYGLIFCDVDKKIHRGWKKRTTCPWFWAKYNNFFEIFGEK